MLAPRRQLPVAIALACACALSIAACGSSKDKAAPAGAVLDRDALAKDLSTRLALGGKDAPKVSCPNDLPVKKGITVRCTATLSGKRFGMTVSVTGTDGSSAQYDIAVDQDPQR